MDDIIYEERIRSSWTTLLFVVLALIFFGLFTWLYSVSGFRFISGLTLFFGLFFLFYIINYRELWIRISSEEIILKFGLVRWKINIESIKEAFPDDSPAMIRYGGAGVHFAFVEGEYRAFYNLLEHPRVVLRFLKKKGPVQALVFTTRQPDMVLDIIHNQKDKL